MPTLEVAGRKSLVLLSGGAYPQLAEEIATRMGVSVTETTRRRVRQRRAVHPAE